MKRFVFAIVLTVLCVATIFGCSFALKKNNSELSEALTVALEASESGDNLLALKTKAVNDAWERVRTPMHILLIHSEMDELELCILSLDDYLRENNPDLYREACVRAINQLENIREANKTSFGNIL